MKVLFPLDNGCEDLFEHPDWKQERNIIRAYPGEIQGSSDITMYHPGDWAARKKRFMTDESLVELINWYSLQRSCIVQQTGSDTKTRGQILQLAPQVRQNPQATMELYDRFVNMLKSLGRDELAKNIVPVIECRSGLNDLYSIRQQARFYSSRGACHAGGWVCIANPLQPPSRIHEQMAIACELVRKELGDVHIHVLGWGWNAEDIRNAAGLKCVDSIDSYRYIEDAKAHRRWETRGGEYIYDGAAHWKDIARHNAGIAVMCCAG